MFESKGDVDVFEGAPSSFDLFHDHQLTGKLRKVPGKIGITDTRDGQMQSIIAQQRTNRSFEPSRFLEVITVHSIVFMGSPVSDYII